MFRYVLFGLIATASLFELNAAKKPEEWSDDNFDANLAKHGKAFVKFYAPWCGHCKRLAPEWEEVANMVDPTLGAIVKVDCTSSGKETCQRFNVAGYPTLKFIKHGDKNDASEKVVDYKGQRDRQSLVAFAKKHGSPVYKELADSDVAKFLKNDVETTFVLFTKSKDTKAFKAFEKVADMFLGSAQFGVSFMKDPSKVLSIASPESLVFQRAQQLVTNVEAENGAEDDIEKFMDFVKYSLHGRVALRDIANDETIPRPLVTVFIASSFKTNSSYFKMIRNRLFPIAELYPNVQFAVASSDDFAGYIDSIGFDPKKDELLFTVDDAEYKRYVPKSSIKFTDLKTLPDLLKQFVADFESGKIEVFYKSAPIPEQQQPGTPVVVVAKNFKSFVTDPTKNVFVKMYAPWCGHCKKLEPIWNELAQKYKDHPTVVIAKFDATANDIPLIDYDITGFPTLFFSKAGPADQKPIQYSGARSLDAFVQFIENNASGKSQEAKDEL